MPASHSIDQELRAGAVKFISSHLNSSTFEVFPLAGDASERRYYRISTADDTLILMDWKPFDSEDRFPFLSVCRHFAKHEVQVPVIFASSPSDGFILLEDLGDLTLERKFSELHNKKTLIPFYKQAIDELIKMHFPSSADRDLSCSAFHVSFDSEKLLWEMNYGKTHLIEKLAKVQLSPTEHQQLDTVFLNICQRLDAQEKFICHRDYHSRNLMIKKGKMRVIDFQDARMGSIQYDLVSLLHDAYVSLNQENINEILEYYIKCASKYITIDRPSFDAIFQIQLIQRSFKACGSFASFYNLRTDKRYLKYICPTLDKVVNALQQQPEYRNFLDILNKYSLCERNFNTL